MNIHRIATKARRKALFPEPKLQRIPSSTIARKLSQSSNMLDARRRKEGYKGFEVIPSESSEETEEIEERDEYALEISHSSQETEEIEPLEQFTRPPRSGSRFVVTEEEAMLEEEAAAETRAPVSAIRASRPKRGGSSQSSRDRAEISRGKRPVMEPMQLVDEDIESKGSEIRSPVLRYFHKALASAFFARETTGTLVNGELEIMDIALRDLMYSTCDGIVMRGDQSGTSISFYLLEQLLSYRGWVERLNKLETKGVMAMGGLVTPILVACDVPMRSPATPHRWIDIKSLIASKTLASKKTNGLYRYKFTHPQAGKSIFLLPCPSLTSVGNFAEFIPPLESLYTSENEAVPMEEGEEAVAGSDEAQPMDESGAYAPERFHFQDYSAPKQNKSQQVAHKHISLLQKWNKMQDKVISTLAKQFHGLQSRFSCSTSSTAIPRDISPREAPLRRSTSTRPTPLHRSGSKRPTPVSDTPSAPARHSVYETREHQAQPSPPRQSSYESRERKKKRKIKQRSAVTRGEHSNIPLEQQPEQTFEHHPVQQPEHIPEQQPESTVPSSSQPVPWSYTSESMDDYVSAFFT
ncbi:unnamed protein product [Arabidopsis arenosa]|uniref:Arabidopsis retrotransposon Orf1 C-terminal domain-containing protein n=1 Tax=Arabidopsis arenosa TaxID=38785 RepID=A0A8S2A9D2_ARAAE|nr:unnamed protein product [Arabidopsis arenosa]